MAARPTPSVSFPGAGRGPEGGGAARLAALTSAAPKRYLALSAKDIAVKVRNPLPSARRDIEIADRDLTCGDTVFQ